MTCKEVTVTTANATSVAREINTSDSHPGDPTIDLLFHTSLERVTHETSHQPLKRHMALLSCVTKMVQQVTGQSDPNLRPFARAATTGATSVSALAHWFVMSVVHLRDSNNGNFVKRAGEGLSPRFPTS